MEDQTTAVPLEEQRAKALAHYDRIASVACEYSSFVKSAIASYRQPTIGAILQERGAVIQCGEYSIRWDVDRLLGGYVIERDGKEVMAFSDQSENYAATEFLKLTEETTVDSEETNSDGIFGRRFIGAAISGLIVMLAADALGYGFWTRQIAMMITVGIALCVTDKSVVFKIKKQ